MADQIQVAFLMLSAGVLLVCAGLLYRDGSDRDIDIKLRNVYISVVLALLVSIVVFAFMISTASVEYQSYSLGGAAAGFFVMFGLLHYALPRTSESELNKQIRGLPSEDRDLLNTLVDNLQSAKSDSEELSPEEEVRKGATLVLKKEIQDWSRRTFRVRSTEVHQYLKSMRDKYDVSEFLAVSVAFPEEFWDDDGTVSEYLEWQRDLLRKHVAVRRIFVLTLYESVEQKNHLKQLMDDHVSGNPPIPISIVNRWDHRKDRGVKFEHLMVMSLKSGEQISGLMNLDEIGRVVSVQFSWDEETVRKTRETYSHIYKRRFRETYENWCQTKYTEWMQTPD